MRIHPNELLMYYHPGSYKDRQTLAMARSLSSHIHQVDYDKVGAFTTMMIEDLLSMLKLKPKDILDKSNPRYQAELKGADLDEEGWLNVIKENPDLIKAPIVVWRNKAILCQKPQDILRL